MDFSEINSPSDLIEANDAAHTAQENVDTLLKPVYDQDPDVALACARDLIENLITLHQDVADIQVREGKTDAAKMWLLDAGRLTAAAEILDNVKL